MAGTRILGDTIDALLSVWVAIEHLNGHTAHYGYEEAAIWVPSAMRVKYSIVTRDIELVRALIRENRSDAFVQRRIQRNINRDRDPITPSRCWLAHMMCLLTTQQKSGPASPVATFLRAKPFPLKLSVVRDARSPDKAVLRELQHFGGIRRAPTISGQAVSNLSWFSGKGWQELKTKLSVLENRTRYETEREVANWLADKMKGLGPKQSRNFIQSLGLSRYEIPIDSRITKWLRDEFAFPLPISTASLSDLDYYCLLSDIVSFPLSDTS